MTSKQSVLFINFAGEPSNKMIYNLIERKQHEYYKVQGRKRLEALSHDLQENE